MRYSSDQPEAPTVDDVRVRRIRIVAWQVRYENRIWGCFILAPELGDIECRGGITRRTRPPELAEHAQRQHEFVFWVHIDLVLQPQLHVLPAACGSRAWRVRRQRCRFLS